LHLYLRWTAGRDKKGPGLLRGLRKPRGDGSGSLNLRTAERGLLECELRSERERYLDIFGFSCRFFYMRGRASSGTAKTLGLSGRMLKQTDKSSSKKSLLRRHAKLTWKLATTVGSGTVVVVIATIANVGEICSSPLVSTFLGPVCPILIRQHQQLPKTPSTHVLALHSSNNLGRAVSGITKTTPILIESDYSDPNSIKAEDYLSEILKTYGFNLVTNKADATVVLRVEDVISPECSPNLGALTTNQANNELPSRCSTSVHIIAQYTKGNQPLFDQAFDGIATGNGNDGGGDRSIENAASNIYEYISGSPKN
jgi:hypothetical protein